MIQSKSTKLKRGTELSLNGTNVWVELDSGGDCVFICYQKSREVTDSFEWVVREDLKSVKKFGSSIKQVVKPVSDEEKKFRKGLNVFFASQTLTMPLNCENCGGLLNAFNAFERRCTIAHILEKSKFKSIATHPQNKMFLCSKGGCHSKFDNSTAVERSQMPVYKLALERFEAFKDVLTDREIIRAYTYLNLEWG